MSGGQTIRRRSNERRLRIGRQRGHVAPSQRRERREPFRRLPRAEVKQSLQSRVAERALRRESRDDFVDARICQLPDRCADSGRRDDPETIRRLKPTCNRPIASPSGNSLPIDGMGRGTRRCDAPALQVVCRSRLRRAVAAVSEIKRHQIVSTGKTFFCSQFSIGRMAGSPHHR